MLTQNLFHILLKIETLFQPESEDESSSSSSSEDESSTTESETTESESETEEEIIEDDKVDVTAQDELPKIDNEIRSNEKVEDEPDKTENKTGEDLFINLSNISDIVPCTECRVVRIFYKTVLQLYLWFWTILLHFDYGKIKKILVENSKFQKKVMDDSVVTHAFTRF